MMPNEKLHTAARQSKLRRIDLEIQLLHRDMADPKALALPLDSVREMSERLASLSNEYTNLSNQDEES